MLKYSNELKIASPNIVEINQSTALVLSAPQTTVFVSISNSQIEIELPNTVPNGQKITFIDINNKFRQFPLILKIGQSPSEKIILKSNNELIFYQNKWNSTFPSITSEESSPQQQITLNQFSSYYQLLTPITNELIVIIEPNYTGQIVNCGDGSKSVILKTIDNSILATLSLTSNIKAITINGYYYSKIEAQFTNSNPILEIPLVVENSSEILTTSIKKLKINSGIINSSYDPNTKTLNLSTNLQAIFTTNKENLGNSSKILNGSSDYFQLLSPINANRTVTVSTTFVGKIINDTDGTYSLILIEEGEETTQTVITELSKNSNIKAILLWHDGNSFVVQQESSYDYEALNNNIYSTTSLKTSDYSAKQSERIPCDTTLGSFTIFAPISGRFQILDATRNFETNPLIIRPRIGSLSTIENQSEIYISNNGVSPEFEFIAETNNWILINTDYTAFNRTFEINGRLQLPRPGFYHAVFNFNQNSNIKIEQIIATCNGTSTISIYKNNTLELPLNSLQITSQPTIHTVQQLLSAYHLQKNSTDFYSIKVETASPNCFNLFYSIKLSYE